MSKIIILCSIVLLSFAAHTFAVTAPEASSTAATCADFTIKYTTDSTTAMYVAIAWSTNYEATTPTWSYDVLKSISSGAAVITSLLATATTISAGTVTLDAAIAYADFTDATTWAAAVSGAVATITKDYTATYTAKVW